MTAAEWQIELRLALDTILVGAACSVSCALLGCYLVLRRMSLVGDAISHAVLPGIAGAFLLTGQLTGWPVFAGALALGVLTAAAAESLRRWGRMQSDASLGVVFTTLFAVGVLMISRAAAKTHLDADCVLYGLIEFTPLDLVSLGPMQVPRAFLTLGLALLVTLGVITLCWKELLLGAFDPALADALGLRSNLVQYLLLGLVSGVTVASFEAVGSILVVAMLIVPAATAQLLTQRLHSMLWCAAGVAVLSTVLGYLGARYWNTSVAGMMSVAAGACLLAAVAFAPQRGLFSKALQQSQLAQRIAREDLAGTLFRAAEASGGNTFTGLRAAELLEPQPRRVRRRALQQLQRQGAVERQGELVRLTNSGLELGRTVVRAHRLWEQYLTENFELPLDHLHEPAERIEHFLGPQLQQDVAAALSEHRTDPHGREIPPESSTD